MNIVKGGYQAPWHAYGFDNWADNWVAPLRAVPPSTFTGLSPKEEMRLLTELKEDALRICDLVGRRRDLAVEFDDLDGLLAAWQRLSALRALLDEIDRALSCTPIVG
jgi:hypothetical protein